LLRSSTTGNSSSIHRLKSFVGELTNLSPRQISKERKRT
jgi:hypothetical protein